MASALDLSEARDHDRVLDQKSLELSV